jgi:adenylate cyclase
MGKEGKHSFVFADIAGYSRLTELDGDEAAADLAIRFATEVAAVTADHGADLVKWIGDAVMLHADEASVAVHLALSVQDSLAQAGLPPVHAGVHTGPAIERAGDWWGCTVNVAARVGAAAAAGQVLISQATKREAGSIGFASVKALGPRRFKNISKPVRVYAVDAINEIAVKSPAVQLELSLPAPLLPPGVPVPVLGG